MDFRCCLFQDAFPSYITSAITFAIINAMQYDKWLYMVKKVLLLGMALE
jgi:hypothetical protein